MSKTTPRDELSTLLDELKNDVDHWELEGILPKDFSHTEERIATIRRGVFLMALDVLYCETAAPGNGYDYYKTFPVQVKLPAEDYAEFKTQLAPYIVWLDSLQLDLPRPLAAIDEQLPELVMPEHPIFGQWLKSAKAT